jgi:hypothetical protein
MTVLVYALLIIALVAGPLLEMELRTGSRRYCDLCRRYH